MRANHIFGVALGVAAVCCATAVYGLINPRFTPIHLVKQASLILSVELKPGAGKDQYTATIQKVLKGKTELKTLSLDLSRAFNTQNADALRNLAAAGKPALFFVGEFAEEQAGQGGPAAAARGYLHVSGQWAEFNGGQQGTWAFRQIDGTSQGVWAGGTDMLRRAVDYILQDDDPEVPVVDGVSWSEPQKIATLAGKIRAVRPVDLAGDGTQVLFIARDEGDQLWSCDSRTRTFTDLSAARRLQSRSQVFAWGDFDGDGRLDLISFDGRTLSLHKQQAGGEFRAQALKLDRALEHGCVGLTALDTGVPRTSGLLIATQAWPVLVAFPPGDQPSLTILTAPGVELAKLGLAGPCLVADFDGEGTADILQLSAGGSVLYRGEGSGRFAPGVACTVKLGAGEAAACLGDFDGDGQFDVLCVSADGVRLWQNEGAGRFTETLELSGEIAYISKPGGLDCQACDINNDGRQDALIAYRSRSPHLFFNRGYRSFGHAHTLDLGERRLLPAADEGQQAACLGDFDGDGAQDMLVALPNGELWSFFRENEDRGALSLTATLPLGRGSLGPATVTGWIGQRGLGAWNVQAGTNPAFFGRREAGPMLLKWKLPGGKTQEQELTIENRPLRFELK